MNHLAGGCGPFPRFGNGCSNGMSRPLNSRSSNLVGVLQSGIQYAASTAVICPDEYSCFHSAQSIPTGQSLSSPHFGRLSSPSLVQSQHVCTRLRTLSACFKPELQMSPQFTCLHSWPALQWVLLVHSTHRFNLGY